MRINTNIMALNAQNKLASNQSGVEKSIQKLSSGLRINGASDDASGLAISEKMRAQIRGLGQAQSNAQDGVSLLQTAEGALQQTTDILQRMRELVIKAQNTGVLTADDKNSITTELNTLKEEVNRIATSTTFNGKKLLDGSMRTQFDGGEVTTLGGKACDINVDSAKSGTTYTFTYNKTNGEVTLGNGTAAEDETISVGATIAKDTEINFSCGVSIKFTEAVSDDINADNTFSTAVATSTQQRADFKIGANSESENTLSVGISSMKASDLGTSGDLRTNIENAENADLALGDIDNAIKLVSAQRSKIGVIQNRMEYAASNLSTTEENLTAAESRIRDVDMAKEMVSYTKNGILNQSAMAMLAQANQQPQQILSLLQ